MSVVPLRRAQPVPLMPAEPPDAVVLRLPVAQQDPQPTVQRRTAPARDRRPRNGHHADCPYPHTAPEHCSVCAGIRKGQP